MALTVSVQKNQIGMATAGMYLMSSIGMVVAISLCAGVQNSALSKALGSLDLEESIARQVMDDVGSVKNPHGDIKIKIIEAYVRSLGASHAVSLKMSGLAFLVSLILREKEIR